MSFSITSEVIGESATGSLDTGTVPSSAKIVKRRVGSTRLTEESLADQDQNGGVFDELSRMVESEEVGDTDTVGTVAESDQPVDVDDEMAALQEEIIDYLVEKKGEHTFSMEEGTYSLIYRYHLGATDNLDKAILLTKFSGTEKYFEVQAALNTFENDQSIDNLRDLFETVKMAEQGAVRSGPSNLGNYSEVDGAIDGVKDGVMTDDELQTFLDADSNNEFRFSYEGEAFTVRKVGNGYKAFDSDGKCVDHAVQINNRLTVDQFVEIGGLSGLSPEERLYIGSPDGETSMWVASANKDGKRGQQLASTALTEDDSARMVVFTSSRWVRHESRGKVSWELQHDPTEIMIR